MLDRLKRHKGTVFVLFLVLVLAAGAFFVKNLTLNSIRISGNHFYTDEQIEDFLFSSGKEKNTAVCYWNNHFGKKKEIPFVERYQIEITGLHEAEVIVYEKNIIGYVKYMGSYMYFDRDGTVVESSSRKLKGICEVKGIAFRTIVLHQKLETQTDSLFDEILLMTQLFEKYSLEINRISLDSSSQVKVSVGDIRVELGSLEDMDLKISELHNILPSLQEEGLKGTLYLNDVQFGASSNGTYHFTKEK